MFRYNQVDANGIITSTIDTYKEFDATLTHMVRIDESLSSDWFKGKRWDGNEWVDIVVPQDTRPSLTVVSVTADDPAAIITPGDITCAAGSVVTATVELRDTSATIVPITKSFRMPIVSRDNRERIVLVSLVEGVANVTIKLPESGVWIIDEKSINNGLPVDQHMRFQTHEIYVTQ